VYIAEKLSHSLFSMMLLSGLFSSVFTLFGLWFSYEYDIASGASIILVSATSLFLFLGVKKLIH
jgi:zinc transport system permease protein